MKLEAVKKYKEPKYPTDNEIKENRDLLFKPLDKWKRIGITSALLVAICSQVDANSVTGTDIIGDFENIRIGGAEPVHTKPVYIYNQDLLEYKNPIIEEMGDDIKIGTEYDFEELLHSFFGWLLVQGII